MPSTMILGAVALVLFLGDAAAAAPATGASAQDTERRQPPSRRKPRILHLPSPSEESQAQRDRRLTRECRGLPNAGACLGYAAARPRGAGQSR